ncbi:MAG TPA: hypothetical protein VFT65_07005 [Candidatus Angelobacter sp.]|nr:hypothetical protein [Candidatus Angelobacter sp.]
MGHDPRRELKDLTTVHNFYLGLLENNLGHGVLVPAEIKKVSETDEDVAAASQNFKQWLDLLDLALAPPLVRDALKTVPGFDTAYALLRYFSAKASQRSGDRDKTDCIITHLFRTPSPDAKSAWERPEVDSSYAFISHASLLFETELYRALGDVQCDSMLPEHVTLLREFEYLYQELEEFRHFDQIMDSGIVQRVRELKQSLGKSFYHPDSLANMAVWNDVFGRKFDELFHDAAMQIKTFAETVQREGGSILSRVEGDITVKNLSEVQTKQILEEDYQFAQDEFRKVSKYKKAVDSKRPVRFTHTGRPRSLEPVAEAPPAPRPTIPQPSTVTSTNVAPPPPPPPQPSQSASGRQPQPGISQQRLGADVLAVAPSQAVQNAVQEGKIQSARQAIKEHARGSDPKYAHIFPVKDSKITLSPAEVEAFKAEYPGEKSFRADYANILMTIVAYLSRMVVEVDEYNHKAGSAYLWKPHADALGYLVSTLERLNMEAQQIMAVARARGLEEKATALSLSLDRLREYAATVSQTLQSAHHDPKG